MCEQTPISYNHGDVVWVKLRRCWWPGEVVAFDQLPTDIQDSLKKAPFAVVKFFQEDSYEYVKNINQIYSYNCTKKIDFIQKGLNSHRAKNKFMENFPTDIEIAEKKTNGNVNILNDPEFAPPKKEVLNYAHIFGDVKASTPKKKSKSSSATSGSKVVTHPRFMGLKDNYEVKFLVQNKPKASTPESSYKCNTCQFTTSNVKIISQHYKSHADGTYKPPSKRKYSPKKAAKSTPKVQDDIFSDSSSKEEDEPPKPKKKAVSGKKRGRKPKSAKVAAPAVEKPKSDFRTNILADWDDDEESDNAETTIADTTITDTTITDSTIDKTNDSVNVTAEKETLEAEDEPKPSTSKKSTKSDNQSCFDFVEDEEPSSLEIPAVSGRKIPRVIPEKRKSSEAEPKTQKEEDKTVSEKPKEDKADKKDKIEDFGDFEDLLAATAVSKIPEMPQVLKYEQNFHSAKTIKFPDKSPSKDKDDKVSPVKEVASPVKEIKEKVSPVKEAESPAKEEKKEEKIINPKKRFVKSFEDETEKKKSEEKAAKEILEAELAEQAKLPEVKNEDNESRVQVSKLKSQLMSKLKDSPSPKKQDAKSTKEKNKSPDIDNIGDYGKYKYKRGLRNYNKGQNAKAKEEEKKVNNKEAPEEIKPVETPALETNENESKITEKEKPQEIVDTTEQSKPESMEVDEPEPPTEIESSLKIDESKLNDSTPTKNEEINVEIEDKKIEPVEKPIEKNEPLPKTTQRRRSRRTSRRKSSLNETTINNENKPIVKENDLPIESIVEKALPNKPEEVKEKDKPEDTHKIEEIQKETLVKEDILPLADILPETPPTEVVEDTSGLNTLAAVSELTTTKLNKEIKQNEATVNERNVTVVSETDLGDYSEVEMANIPVDAEGHTQQVMLSNFSMDFEDSSKLEIAAPTAETTKDEPVESVKEPEKEEKKAVEVKTTIEKSNETTVPLENNSIESQVAKLTDTKVDSEPKPPQENKRTTSSKLLDILTETKVKSQRTMAAKQEETLKTKIDIKSIKLGTKLLSPVKGPRSAMLHEKVIAKPVSDDIAIQKVSNKRSLQDIDDIDSYIIQKPNKKAAFDQKEEIILSKDVKRTPNKGHGKARIIQQTIISSSGAIIQPDQQAQTDDFDINSMPIVLSDQILTAESLEKMPIVLSDSVQSTSTTKTIVEAPTPIKKTMKIVGKSPLLTKEHLGKQVTNTPTILRTVVHKQGAKASPKVYTGVGSTKVLKNTSIVTPPGKPSKFIIVPSGSATGTKYTVGKKQIATPKKILHTAVKTTPEPTGNKVMILTNNLGQKSRVILTPAQQKILNSPSGPKFIEGAIKHTIPKNMLKESSSGISKVSQTIITSKGQITTTTAGTVTTSGAIIQKNIKIDSKGRKMVQLPTRKVYSKVGTSVQQVVLHNQGQVKKVHGNNDEALLEQQVQQQIQAINKASGQMLLNKAQRKVEAVPKTVRAPAKKQVVKKAIPATPEPKMSSTVVQRQTVVSSTPSNQSSINLPALAPLSPTKKVEVKTDQAATPTEEVPTSESQKQPASYVIQDALGNQTTITEGQILAFPSETVDGQPQSYMLVTVDESGNLKPLNNETLMTLDPSLGDVSNMMLQFDQGDQQGASTSQAEVVDKPAVAQNKPEDDIAKANVEPAPVPEVSQTPAEILEPKLDSSLPVTSENTLVTTSAEAALSSLVTNDSNQQLFITGDPVATQKLIDSLAEGNADLANILANAEGNILIQADGQQFLINAGGNRDPQMLLMNAESPEVSGNPVFGGQTTKNQDILAAALANTDVFQPEVPKVQSQLSPTGGLYPMNVSGVLETSAMNSPIMSPLETPKNNKKINDENDILTQVPKNVDLPITITDPNISQTVAQQQVSLMAKELHTNLDLPLTITDPSSITSSEMNSPSYVFSLPSLEDTVGISSKPFTPSISMPLLSDDTEESLVSSEPAIDKPADEDKKDDDVKKDLDDANGMEINGLAKSESSSLLKEEEKSTGEPFMGSVASRMCSIQSSICNSLSEPPPDMFDFPINQNFGGANEKASTDGDMPIDSSTDNTNESSLSNNINEEMDLLNQDTLQAKAFGSENNSEELELFEGQKSETPTFSNPADLNSPSTNNTDENSCEIPVQPEIITDLNSTTFDEKETIESALDSSPSKRKFLDSDEDNSLEKRCKFD